MALTTDEQELFDLAPANLPKELFRSSPQEPMQAAAKLLGAARAQLKAWVDAAYLKTSAGDWLDQHAKDRSTRRQNGESDAALRERLRHVEDALTPSAILSAINAILTAEGVPGSAALVVLPSDQAFVGQCFASRGYRAGHPGRPHVLIVILPYGTTAAVKSAIAEVLSTKSAAGKTTRIEVRQTP